MDCRSWFMRQTLDSFQQRQLLRAIWRHLDFLHKQHVANMELYQATQRALHQDMVALQNDIRTEMPKYFDFNDIITKARELYGFVSTK